jgi:hypothetical protein
VRALRDDVPRLVLRAVAVDGLNWREVGAEVAREGIHGEAFAVRGLLLH